MEPKEELTPIFLSDLKDLLTEGGLDLRIHLATDADEGLIEYYFAPSDKAQEEFDIQAWRICHDFQDEEYPWYGGFEDSETEGMLPDDIPDEIISIMEVVERAFFSDEQLEAFKPEEKVEEEPRKEPTT